MLFARFSSAIAGEYDFENRINAKSWQKELLRPSTRITSIVKLFMAPGLSKIGGNICISHLWALFGSSVCHDGIYCMHFGWRFHSSALLLQSFCWNATRTRKLIAQICKASTACKVCRIHVPMMTSFWIQWIHWLHWIHVVLLESPTLNCMLYFTTLHCRAEQK